jgi:hypothetical protein
MNTIKIPLTLDTYMPNYWPPLSGRLHALLLEQAFQNSALEFFYTEKSTKITRKFHHAYAFWRVHVCVCARARVCVRVCARLPTRPSDYIYQQHDSREKQWKVGRALGATAVQSDQRNLSYIYTLL